MRAGRGQWSGPRLWCRFWVLTQPLEEQLSLSTPASCCMNQSNGTYVSGAGGEGRFMTACVRGLSAQSVSSVSIIPMTVVQRFTARHSTVPQDLPNGLGSVTSPPRAPGGCRTLGRGGWVKASQQPASGCGACWGFTLRTCHLPDNSSLKEGK